MIRLFHFLWVRVGTVVGRVEAAERLFSLLLVEDIEMRAVRRLDSNDETLLLSTSTITIGIIIPDRQVLQIFVCHVSIFSMLGVRKDFLFLLLQFTYKII